MKLVERTDKRIVFQLRRAEHEIILEILQRYPVLRASERQLSSTSDDPQLVESQRLLQEALEEQKQSHRQELDKWLKHPDHLQPHKNGYRLNLAIDEVEWFLQVLNDVRVGSWVAIGKPESGRPTAISFSVDHLPFYFAMEMAGFFQNFILHALNSDLEPSGQQGEEE